MAYGDVGMMQQSIDNKIQELIRDHPDLFPTEARFWSYLRGCLRRGLWEKSSLKFKYKNSQVTPPPEGYLGRGRKGDYCALSGVWTPTSKLEVDHIEGNKSLRCVDDILPYVLHLLADAGELQLVSKEAHRVKSYADKQGITFEQARIVKQAIAIQKDLDDKQWLLSRNIPPASNAKARREQIIEALTSLSEAK